MASPSVTEAGKFSISAIPDRYFLDCRPSDQLFDLMPFEPVVGKDLKINYVDGSNLATHATAETAGGSIDATIPAINDRTFSIARLSGELEVDSILPSIYGSKNNLVEALISLKVNAVRDLFKSLLIEGNSGTPGEFDGLRQLCDGYSQKMGANDNNANGGDVLKGEMEQLLAMINPRKADGSTYFVMHADGFTQLLKNNYSYVEYSAHPVLGSVPAIAGVPVLIDDFVPVNETKGTSTTTSIYAVRLGKDTGLWGIYPAADEGQPIQVRGPVVIDNTGSQYYHVSWNVGIAVATKCSIARMDGVLPA